MKLIPMHDNIFVEKDKAVERRTPGGLVLPEDVQQIPDTATVIAVGSGRELENGGKIVPKVSPGDKILVSRFSGTEVNWGMEKRLIVAWTDILGVVEDSETEDVKISKTEKK